MITIKPSAAIRKNYNEIARRESMLRLREQLVVSEEERLNGKPGYTVDQVDAMMKKAIAEVTNG